MRPIKTKWHFFGCERRHVYPSTLPFTVIYSFYRNVLHPVVSKSVTHVVSVYSSTTVLTTIVFVVSHSNSDRKSLGLFSLKLFFSSIGKSVMSWTDLWCLYLRNWICFYSFYLYCSTYDHYQNTENFCLTSLNTAFYISMSTNTVVIITAYCGPSWVFYK